MKLQKILCVIVILLLNQDSLSSSDSIEFKKLVKEKNTYHPNARQEVDESLPKFLLKCCVIGSLSCVCIGGMVFSFIPLIDNCYTDLALYPTCKVTNSNGVNTYQSILANYYGNHYKDDYKGLAIGEGYCNKPLRTVCLNYHVEKNLNSTNACKKIKNGKLLGVAFSESVCGNPAKIAKKIEKEFNSSRIPYCKISPNQVDINQKQLLPIFLILYLVQANADSAYVQKKRWTTPWGLQQEGGSIWGKNSNCHPDYSKNSDPSFKRHQNKKKQLQIQKQQNGTKTLKRKNYTIVRHKSLKNKKLR